MIKWLTIILIGLFSLSSCKIVRDLKKGTSDSTAIKKEAEVFSRIDTSKTTKEKDYERITYIFPKDTNIIHNHYHTQKPSVIIQERGVEKEQTNSFNYEDWKRELLDSMRVKEQTKAVESTTRLGPSTIEWILIAAVGILLLKSFNIINIPPRK